MNNLLLRCNPTRVGSALAVSAANKGISTTCATTGAHLQDEPPQGTFGTGESPTVKRARLVYQSRKRGMLENGLLLSTFAKKYLEGFDDQLLHQYDCLINVPSNDWDIYYWAVGAKPVPAEFDNQVMTLLQKHIKNDARESRSMQPDLH